MRERIILAPGANGGELTKSLAMHGVNCINLRIVSAGEVPFCYSEDGQDGKILWNGIMDVVYCAQGKWHIVDYKTNADGNDLDKKYQAQLSAYIKAFKATTGEDADARTYHIDI